MTLRSRPGAGLRSALLVPLLAGFSLAIAPPMLTARLTAPAHAQPLVPPSAVRAINLARSTVVRLNGGLGTYRPAQCMFSSPVPANSCLSRDDEQGYLFHFVGGPPAWEQRNRMPTLETEILVDPEGRMVKEVIYNGEPRPAARAISLARTHTIQLNGGLGVYVPAQCMFAPAATRGNACLVREDGSGYRFRFMGGPPDWERDNQRPTMETEILISADGRSVVEVDYNGAPR